MAIPVQISISLRDQRGVVVSRLIQVSDRTLEVEGETARLPGERLEFQFELEGFHATLYGEAVVERVTDPEFGRGRCFLNIVEIERRRKALFREWLYEMSQGGGTPRRPHAHLDSVISSTACSRAGRREEGEARLRVLERTRSQVGSRSMSAPGGSSMIGTRGGVGRKALRAALATYGAQPASQPPPDGEPLPAASSAPTRRDRRGTEPPRADGAGSKSLRRKRRRVDVRIAHGAKPPLVVVRYNDPLRYNKHYWEHLQRKALQVRCRDADLPAGSEIRLRIVMPGGAVVSCPATVELVMPNGLGLVLELDAGDAASLRLSAGRDRRGISPEPAQSRGRR